MNISSAYSKMASRHSILLMALLQSVYSTSLTGNHTFGSPTVLLDNGTFVGVSEGSVSAFRGIPYAKPPYVLNHLCEPALLTYHNDPELVTFVSGFL